MIEGLAAEHATRRQLVDLDLGQLRAGGVHARQHGPVVGDRHLAAVDTDEHPRRALGDLDPQAVRKPGIGRDVLHGCERGGDLSELLVIYMQGRHLLRGRRQLAGDLIALRSRHPGDLDLGDRYERGVA